MQPPVRDVALLRRYLSAVGEVGLRTYVWMLISQLRERASRTSSDLDDLLIVALQVLVARVFPPPPPDKPAE